MLDFIFISTLKLLYFRTTWVGWYFLKKILVVAYNIVCNVQIGGKWAYGSPGKWLPSVTGVCNSSHRWAVGFIKRFSFYKQFPTVLWVMYSGHCIKFSCASFSTSDSLVILNILTPVLTHIQYNVASVVWLPHLSKDTQLCI